jgi:hypothetical protein
MNTVIANFSDVIQNSGMEHIIEPSKQVLFNRVKKFIYELYIQKLEKNPNIKDHLLIEVTVSTIDNPFGFI